MGLAISKHYCSGSFVSFSVFSEANSCCGDSDCCHNENQFFKVQSDFSSPQTIDMPELSIIDISGDEMLSVDIPDCLKAENKTIVLSDLPPPRKIQKSLALKQTYLL